MVKEDDEENGDDLIGVSDKCLKKPTSIQLESAIGTLLNFGLSGFRLDPTLHHGNFLIDASFRKRLFCLALLKGDHSEQYYL